MGQRRSQLSTHRSTRRVVPRSTTTSPVARIFHFSIVICTLALIGCRGDDPRTRQAHAEFSDFGPPAADAVTLSDGTVLNTDTPPLAVAKAALQAMADDVLATRDRDAERITDARHRLYFASAPIVADLVPSKSPEAADPQTAVRAVNSWWTQRVAFYLHELLWPAATVREDAQRATVTVPGRSATAAPHTPATGQIEITLTLTPGGWRVLQVNLLPPTRTRHLTLPSTAPATNTPESAANE